MFRSVDLFSHLLRSRAIVLGSAVLISLLGVIAYASIPDADGVIHVCYRTSNGSMRVIDTDTASCNGNEVALSFNQTGPQGPQGPSGLSGPQIMPGDYDGDGKTDPAIYADGTWKITRSVTGETTSVPFGETGDIPIIGDYDGDGKTDLVFYRPSTESLWVRYSHDETTIVVIPF